MLHTKEHSIFLQSGSVTQWKPHFLLASYGSSVRSSYSRNTVSSPSSFCGGSGP